LAFGILHAVTNSSIYAVKKKPFVYNVSHSSQVELVTPISKVCASTTLSALIMQNKKMLRVVILAQHSYQISSEFPSTFQGEMCRQTRRYYFINNAVTALCQISHDHLMQHYSRPNNQSPFVACLFTGYD